ncbi:MAG: hypothetical protein AAF928_13655 [Myxococcota bacterium]
MRPIILVVDEGTASVWRYVRWLIPLSEVHVVSNADDALRRLRIEDVDGVLWCLPDHAPRSGIHVVSRLERCPRLRRAVVVVASEHPSPRREGSARCVVVTAPPPPKELWYALVGARPSPAATEWRWPPSSSSRS